VARHRRFSPARTWLRFLALFGAPRDIRTSLQTRQRIAVRWVAASCLVGVLVGAGVAVFEFFLSDQLVAMLYSLQSNLAYALLPTVGLVGATLLTRFAVPSREGSLTEDYILVYHDKSRYMRWQNIPGKMLASVLTIATGGSMGLEGPSIYFGAALGDTIQRRLRRVFSEEDGKMLLVAGCAAGMAAIFKAPLTGVIFAVESPYKDGMASRRLISPLVASAASYVTFVLLAGNEPLFAHDGLKNLSVVDILLSVVLGVCCGIGARFFVWMMTTVKEFLRRMPAWMRPLVAGTVVGGLGLLVYSATAEPFNYGPGYHLIRHVLAVQEPLSLLMFLFVAKSVATAFTSSGGGVGGIFFPMAAMGTIMGAGFNHIVAEPGTSLYPIIGTAAFVGAGYRTPLAAVAFVAETMGNPWALIPAMLATVASLMVMGNAGISDLQRPLPVAAQSDRSTRPS
jgi:chloride channel protein, CIC family